MMTRAAWAFVGIALLLGLGNVVQYAALKSSNVRADRFRSAANLCSEAQVTNLDTIKKLEQENSGWAARSADELRRAKDDFDHMRDYAASLQRQKSEAEDKLKVIYARDPKAREWSAVLVPAAVGKRLHENAGSDRQDP